MFGKTRQAYYKLLNHEVETFTQETIVLEMVKKERKKAKTKRWGGRKIYSIIKEDLEKQNIKMGRDKLFDLLRSEGMLVKPRKRHFFTTQSHHWLHKYEYLIDGMELTAPNQLWVSDITYVESQDEVLYLYLITDAYSKMIIGWYISTNLKADSAVKALKMALRNNPDISAGQLIHHSDRGVQYCSYQYVEILNKYNIKISMTHGGSPHQNSIAERVNGIIKDEWLYDMELKNRDQAEKKIKDIIKVYNTKRPHQSLNYDIPAQVHQMGFLRNGVESVIIGSRYKNKKAGLNKTQPLPTNASKSQLFLTGCSPAEPASASLRQNKNDKKINGNKI